MPADPSIPHPPGPYVVRNGSLYAERPAHLIFGSPRLLKADRDEPATSPVERDAIIHRAAACMNALGGVPTADLERITARFPNDPAARLRYLRDVLNKGLREGF